jgi:hypothetical protein
MEHPRRWKAGDRVINKHGIKGTIICLIKKNKWVHGRFDNGESFGFTVDSRYKDEIGFQHLNALERFSEDV